MRKHILYILGVGAMAFSSCDDAVDEVKSQFLSGDAKTPVEVVSNISTGTSTRATDDCFQENDQLVAYIRHVTGSASPYTVVTGTGVDPRLVNFKVSALTTGHLSAANNYDQTVASKLVCTDAAGFYWDDYSIGAEGEDKHLRTSGHSLQSYYGYCYNGGSPKTALVPESGELGWEVPYDQSSVDKLRSADLLWSGEQTPITYDHATFNSGKDHGLLEIPFTHAMSMFTVIINIRDGFKTGDLAGTNVELEGVMRAGTTMATNKTISGTSVGTANAGKVKMFGAAETSPTVSDAIRSRSFQGIVMPQTLLTAGNKLLTISNVDGNYYDVKVTTNMLSSWAAGLSDNKTLSGINYQLTITLDKQTVSLKTTLANWTTLPATGTADIQFDKDVVDNCVTIIDDDGVASDIKFEAIDTKTFVVATDGTPGSSFDLYTLKYASEGATTNDKFNSRATISEYKHNNTKNIDEWVNNPLLYWPNASDQYYFRAVAKFKSESETTYDIVNTGTSASLVASQGEDLVWGTTPAHKGYLGTSLNRTYAEGAPIYPRTGDVPISFKHIMSKITIKLKTADATEDDPMYSGMVDLTGALVSISNIATSGTLQLYNGTININSLAVTAIEDFAAQSHPVADHTTLNNYIVVPQDIPDACKLVVKLTSGAVYSITLNTCTDASGTVITNWESGRHYEYTIYLEKEKITFRALIKDWVTEEGKGSATLDWD